MIDVELSHAPIEMDGRPTLLCFAVDVTERNALRREFLEATDLERRRLADELRYGFGHTLGELELGSYALGTIGGHRQSGFGGHRSHCPEQPTGRGGLPTNRA